MVNILRLTILGSFAILLVSCATPPVAKVTAATHGRVQKVRTTAYSGNEGSGSRNAIGRQLASAGIMSASSDWSRFPLGTRFRIVESNDEYVIDDYGGALLGTNTIDLYKSSHLAMQRWGVRHVDIEVTHWGSEDESLKVLRTRKGARICRRMIASLEDKRSEVASTRTSSSDAAGPVGEGPR